MKTKYFLLLTAILLFTTSSYGQRLKDKRVSINYISLPTTKLPDDYKTYSVDINGVGLFNKNTEAVQMHGFKRVSGKGTDFGHLRIYVDVGNIVTGKAQLRNHKNTKKDKKTGKETTTIKYSYEVPYSARSSYEVVDLDGKRLAFANVNTDKNESTSRYSSRSKAFEAYKKNRNRVKEKVRAEAAQEVINTTNKVLATKFDFHYTKASTEFYIIKKHKTEEGFMKSFESAKAAYESLSAITPVEEAKEKLAFAMKFWSEQADIDPKGNKKQMRIYEAANYNLAIAYYYLDDLDKAQAHTEAIMESEGKDKKAKKLLKKIEGTRKLMHLHGIKTLHHVRDLSDAMSPARVAAYEREQARQEQQEEKAVESDINIEATITLKDKEMDGRITVKGNDEDKLAFGKDGNIQFVMEVEGESKEYDLTAADVSAFTLGNRSFEKLAFSPCAKSKAAPEMHILEEIYTSEKITLYKYYPSSGLLSGEKTEFAFQKTGETIPISLLDTQFLIFNTGLSKYFADCADLTKMCSDGQIEMNKDDLIKAARIYTELCR